MGAKIRRNAGKTTVNRKLGTMPSQIDLGKNQLGASDLSFIAFDKQATSLKGSARMVPSAEKLKKMPKAGNSNPKSR